MRTLCYRDLANAASMYDKLTKVFRDVSLYTLYHAQSLLKAGRCTGTIAQQI